MKRPLFIIIGVLLVFVLLGVWVYILFFGSPANNNQDSFTDLNFGDTTDGTYVEGSGESEESVVDINGTERLRQLTTKPTIGYQEVLRNASSTPEVVYIEAGTGHMFSINIETGEEKRISGTTIPLSSSAVITPNGNFAMIKSGSGFGREFILGELSTSTNSLITSVINENIIDFKATNDNKFIYAVQTNNSVTAKEYDPVKNTNRTLFTVPFREVIIGWGSNASDTHYAYPKTSSKLEGFLYKITGSKVERLPIAGFGLSAVGSSDSVIYSKQMEGKYKTYFYNINDGSATQSAIKMIPEKCTPLTESSTKYICGTTLYTYNDNTPDDWYQGTASYLDSIWEIDISRRSATILSDTLMESSRELDMINLSVNNKDSNLYFINKNNNFLWMYELVSPNGNTQ